MNEINAGRNMTMAELKSKKVKLEAEMVGLINDFCRTTSLNIERVDFVKRESEQSYRYRVCVKVSL